MSSIKERDKAEKEFDSCIRKALSGFIGDKPSVDSFRITAQQLVDDLVKGHSLKFITDLSDLRDFMVDILLVHFGMGDAISVEEKLKAASDSVIERLFHAFNCASPIVNAEYAVRNGTLQSWKMEDDRTMTIALIQPLNYIRTEFVIDKEGVVKNVR